MAFNKETGSSAGKKSKRGSSKEVKEIREVFSELLNDNKDKLQGWIDEVGETDPAKAIDLLIKLTSFVLPKFRQVDYQMANDNIINVIDLGPGTKPEPELDYSKLKEETLRDLIDNGFR